MVNNFSGDLIKNSYFLAKEAKEKARNELEMSYGIREERFDKTVSRQVWHVVGWRTRLITSPLGDIKITRRIYRLKHNPRIIKILFDQHINLESHKTFLKEMDHFIVTKIPGVKSYAALVDLLGFDISSSTISRIVSRHHFNFIPKQLAKATPIVFINMDGIYTNRHKDKRRETKCVVAFTGVKIQNNRKTLVNRMILPYQDNVSSEEIANRTEAWLMGVYGEIQAKVVIGDGANWISNVARHMGAKRYIDRFHFKKWVRDFVGKKVKVSWESVLAMNYEQLQNYLLQLIADGYGVVNTSTLQKSLLAKIKHFFKSFKEISEHEYISCIEGIQSHYVASYFKARRAFNSKNTYKVMLLNLINVNGWELTKEGIVNDEFYEGVRINVSSYRESKFSNVPYLSSTSSEVVKHLNSMIHC